MYGEFGHVITQTNNQWIEAQQYAGGAFLEYSNVWWKGTANQFGIVDQYGKIVPGRFNVVKGIYT